MESAIKPSQGKDDRHASKRRNRRRVTVSGFPLPLPSHNDEGTTRPRSSSEAMRFPWSSIPSPASPTSSSPLPQRPSSATSTSTTTSSARNTGHKRAISGNILSKLNFLRSTSSEDTATTSATNDKDSPSPRSEKAGILPRSPTKSLFSFRSADDESLVTSPRAPGRDAGAEREKNGDGAWTVAMRQVKPRRRKDSLRKTALLGGGARSRDVGPGGKEKERKGDPVPRGGQGLTATREVEVLGHDADEDAESRECMKNGEGYVPLSSPNTESSPIGRARRASTSTASTTSSISSVPDAPAATLARLSLHTELQHPQPRSRTNNLGSPVDAKSPATTESATSPTSTTTSEDDPLSFDRPISAVAEGALTSPQSPPLTNEDPTSYFPIPKLPRPTRASPKLHSASPLSRLPLSANPDTLPRPSTPLPLTTSSGYPQLSTETWGYLILLLTWLTFTIGMGSCLEIWSWAWDAGGRKPSAPPELEDDDTLPIVGYYPALIVLVGGVVSWVWVGVAWVGMKYFRHAKVEV